ncbi:MAG: SAM-dependent chlorinase/fluorinase [Anaerolineae bacterium]|nr:SAM-dependent chlorinase/fluorinase [Anaerolineae bacterium]
MEQPTIALLTDFGLRDAYVGVMKAVMRRICSGAALIDLTHAIEPQAVREAALTLLSAYAYFPAGTIFLVVVDPGVGTTRRPVAVAAGDYQFVAPDNGVLSYVLELLPDVRSVELTQDTYRLHPTSQTFHGRDIFAPAAAHLAAGVSLPELGPTLHDLMRLPAPRLDIVDGCLLGEIVHIDHFGNVVTSIGTLTWTAEDVLQLQPQFGPSRDVRTIDAAHAVVACGDQEVAGIFRAYGQAARGQMLTLVGSSGFLELAINQGNGAAALNIAIGDPVELRV